MRCYDSVYRILEGAWEGGVQSIVLRVCSFSRPDLRAGQKEGSDESI